MFLVTLQFFASVVMSSWGSGMVVYRVVANKVQNGSCGVQQYILAVRIYPQEDYLVVLDVLWRNRRQESRRGSIKMLHRLLRYLQHGCWLLVGIVLMLLPPQGRMKTLLHYASHCRSPRQQPGGSKK